MSEVRPTPSAAPMAAAPFVWRADGRPAWSEMWESFCDLALHGGPPHRGAADALRGPAPSDPVPSSDPEMLREMCRGILETTGLIVEEASTAAIVLENVAARADGCRLLLPAGPRYRLADEVKSVITVVAKTHHYWSAHAPVGHPAPAAPGTSRMPRPLKVGVGGPAGSGKTSLIDALCRRLAGRLGVRVIAGAESARDHPDPDLVLIERTGEDLAATLGPAIVDATIGVVDHRAGVELARRGAPVVTRSHLLVVNAFGADAPAVRGAAREALLERRRGRPVIFADCRAGGGVDEVLDWLEHDLLLGAQLP